MFDIGPAHLMVLAIVGVLVLGPEKLPDLARDAGRMLRSIRELAAGARDRVRALVAWAQALVCKPNSISDADAATLREVGLTDRAIFEATKLVALRRAFRRSTTRSALNLTRNWPGPSPGQSEIAVTFVRPPASEPSL